MSGLDIAWTEAAEPTSLVYVKIDSNWLCGDWAWPSVVSSKYSVKRASISAFNWRPLQEFCRRHHYKLRFELLLIAGSTFFKRIQAMVCKLVLLLWELQQNVIRYQKIKLFHPCAKLSPVQIKLKSKTSFTALCAYLDSDLELPLLKPSCNFVVLETALFAIYIWASHNR